MLGVESISQILLLRAGGGAGPLGGDIELHSVLCFNLLGSSEVLQELVDVDFCPGPVISLSSAGVAFLVLLKR